MNLKSVTKLEKSQVELEVEVAKEEFEIAVDKAFHKNAPKITVPGFRKGKAPRKMIEKYYGESVFFEDAVNESYPKAYEAAVEAASIDPIDKAEVDVINLDANGYTFKAKVTVQPEVTLGNYKGLKAEKAVVVISDEKINAEVDKLRNRNARLVAVTDRAAAMEDTVVIDYAGSVNGEAFQGGTAEAQSLKLGSGQFIPGFEEQLVGKNTGDEFDVNVTFPETYHADELAGKPAVFKVKLHEIQYTELPELDNEFVKDISEFDTVEDFKADLSTKLEAAENNAAEQDFEDKLIDQISDGTQVEIPEVLVNRQIEQIAQDFESKLRAQGLNFETYLKITGSSFDDFKKNFSEQAEKRAKVRLILEQIAKAEGLKAAEDELEKEYEQLSKQYNMELEKLKAIIPAHELSSDLVITKAIDFIKSNAISSEPVEQVQPSAEKAAKTKAKKAASKE